MPKSVRNYRVVFLLSLAMLGGSCATAMGQDCASLGRLQCETSADCISVKEANGTAGKYACIPAVNDCQVGFRQLRVSTMGGQTTVDKSYDPAAACQSRQGCKFVPAGDCYCPPFANISCYCVGGSPSNCVAAGG